MSAVTSNYEQLQASNNKQFKRIAFIYKPWQEHLH